MRVLGGFGALFMVVREGGGGYDGGGGCCDGIWGWGVAVGWVAVLLSMYEICLSWWEALVCYRGSIHCVARDSA